MRNWPQPQTQHLNIGSGFGGVTLVESFNEFVNMCEVVAAGFPLCFLCASFVEKGAKKLESFLCASFDGKGTE